MIRRHAPPFSGMSEFYTDSETGAPLLNDRGDLANDIDIDRFLSRPEVLQQLDRLTLEMGVEDRRMKKNLSECLIQVEFDAFNRQRRRGALCCLSPP